MNDTSTKVVALAVVLLAAVLLVGARIGYEWAGGDGVEQPLTVTNGERWGTDCAVESADTQRRHEMTCAGQNLRFDFGATTFTLDENTDISIVRDDASNPVVSLVTGRAVIDGEITVSIRDIKIFTSGVVTLVHYSWLDKVDLKVISGSAEIRQGTYSSTVTAGNAVAIDTLPPYDAIAPTEVNLEAESVRAFYENALE